MKTAWHALVVLPLFALSLSACASGAPSSGTTRTPNLITQEDIQGTNYSSAYEVVQRLRPRWLRARQAPSFGGEFAIMVYVDNVRYGEVESLRSIPAPTVGSMEWIDAGTATQRWGTGNAGGAIAVTTQRGG